MKVNPPSLTAAPPELEAALARLEAAFDDFCLSPGVRDGN